MIAVTYNVEWNSNVFRLMVPIVYCRYQTEVSVDHFGMFHSSIISADWSLSRREFHRATAVEPADGLLIFD